MPQCFFAGWVDSFAFTMVAPFLIDHGMSLTQYGIFIPLVGILGRGSAAYVVPKVIERWSLRVAALVGAVGFLAEGAFYSQLARTGPATAGLATGCHRQHPELPLHALRHVDQHVTLPLGVEGTGRHRLLDPVQLLFRRYQRRHGSLRLPG